MNEGAGGLLLDAVSLPLDIGMAPVGPWWQRIMLWMYRT